jgi:RNA polymerase sigma factor (sigma-70 family)
VDIDDTADLVRAAAAGDPAAWTSLVRRFSGLVWSVARGHRLGSADAEDVCQTTWLRLAESIHRIEHPERVTAWLIVTARREALRTIQVAARVTPVADFDGAGPGLRDDDSPESVTLRREQATLDRNRARDLWGALHRLSPRCQALLRLLMTNPPPRYADVADGLDMPIGSIGPTRRRCLGHLGRLADRRGITQDVEPS